MFKIQFYTDKNGDSEIVNYLDELNEKGKTNKDARINKEKILTYMTALAKYGTRIGFPIVRHIEGDIWELRPLKNRIFFFYWKKNTYILLHHFMKKTKKTPKREIDIACTHLDDFLERDCENEEY